MDLTGYGPKPEWGKTVPPRPIRLEGVHSAYLGTQTPRAGFGLHIAMHGTRSFVLATFIFVLPTTFPRDRACWLLKEAFVVKSLLFQILAFKAGP